MITGRSTTLLSILLLGVCAVQFGSPPARAANIGITVNPLALRTETKLHRLVYVAQLLAAGASLGADGYSTEVAVVRTPRNLRRAGYGCNPCVVESNALFLDSSHGVQSFSQAKFWTYKGLLAAGGFGMTYAIHKAHKDTVSSDVASIVASSAAAALFTTVAMKNLHLADKITAENHAAGLLLIAPH